MNNAGTTKRCRRKRRVGVVRNTNILDTPVPQKDDLASDLPGFYYDAETKRYFRLLPGSNNNNPITRATIQAKKTEDNCRDIVRSNLERHSRPIPRSVTSLQLGSLRTGGFTHSVYSLQMASLSLFSKLDLADLAQDDLDRLGGMVSSVGECTHLVGHPESGLLIGSWATESEGGRRGSLVRTLNVTETGIAAGTIVNVHPQHKVVDLCVFADEKKDARVTYVCVNADCTVSPSSFVSSRLVGIAEDPRRDLNESWTREYERSAVWSCASSRDGLKTAVGLERRAELYAKDDHRPTKVWTQNENPLALEFNADGNLLYVGTHKGNVVCVDLRERTTSTCTYVVSVGRGVSYLRLLKAEDALIVSAHDGKLMKIDLLSRKVVQTFKGYHNDGMKLPFSYDETNHTLCSSGQDRVTRLWSLNDPAVEVGPLTALMSPSEAGCHQPWSWYSNSWATFQGKPAVCLAAGNGAFMFL